MDAVFHFGHTVIAQPGRPAPYCNVTVSKRILLYGIGPLDATELECCGQLKRNRDDWIAEITLILVLMERKPSPCLVTK
jgi:hypothetical protein